MKLLDILKPSVPKSVLYFTAGMLWLISSLSLYIRSLSILLKSDALIYILLSFPLGIGYYYLMFKKITTLYIQRIDNISLTKPCFFSFFSFKSYALIIIMISMGIGLKETGYVSPVLLYAFLLMMGTPLLISSLRFFIRGVQFIRE